MSFQLYPNVEYDSSHRFSTKSQRDGVSTLVLLRTDSAFHRGVCYVWGDGGIRKPTDRHNQEIKNHLKPNEASSQTATYSSCFRKNLVTPI